MSTAQWRSFLWFSSAPPGK